jgi:AraC-like DNA-binding protein
MKVEDLARLVQMSVSSFHEHFKSVTSMSSLHYQKVLRLQEARRLMLSTMMDAGSASRRVGYLSASQFSRNTAASTGVRRARTSPDCGKRHDSGREAIRSELRHSLCHPKRRTYAVLAGCMGPFYRSGQAFRPAKGAGLRITAS